MVNAAGVTNEDTRSYAEILDIEKGMIALEVGWDEDCDPAISESIEDVLGDDFLEDDTDEDGDLVDGLVDSLRPVSDGGRIWLLTPGAGKPGTVEPGVIAESAQLSGLVQTKAERLGDWQGSCLVGRGYTKK